MLLLPCAAVLAVRDVFLLTFNRIHSFSHPPFDSTYLDNRDQQMEIVCSCLHLRSNACEETFRVTRCLVVFLSCCFSLHFFLRICWFSCMHCGLSVLSRLDQWRGSAWWEADCILRVLKMEIWTVMSWVPDWVAWGRSAPEMHLCLCMATIRKTDKSKGREGTVLIK
jgi:hypothetical protein